MAARWQQVYRTGSERKAKKFFVPGQSGSVACRTSPIPTAEEIGAAVASAMQRAPIVVPQDPVTDALYRNGPRRAALHGVRVIWVLWARY